MKDLNKFKILLFACLLFICAVSLGQSGPTPLIQVDADQIIDGAVSAIKVDGSIAKTADVYNKQEVDSKLGDLASELMENDGSNAAATVAFPGDITGVNASFTGAVEAATINGVVPLTEIERTQALVGSSTTNHAAKMYSYTDLHHRGASRKYAFYQKNIVSGATVIYEFGANSTAPIRAEVVVVGYYGELSSPFSAKFTDSIVYTSAVMYQGGQAVLGTPDTKGLTAAWTSPVSGKLRLTVSNTGVYNSYDTLIVVEIFSYRAHQMHHIEP